MGGQTELERLKAELKQKQPGCFYVFYGQEAYLRAYYLEQLRRLVVDEATEAFNYHRFTASNLSVQAVGDAIEALPMMAERTMVQIDDVNFFALNAEDAALYARFFSELPDYCTLVLVYDTVEYKPDKRKKALYEAFSKALAVDFQPAGEGELVRWAERHLRRRGVAADPALCRYLVRRTGGDMTTLLSEIEKLCAFSEGGALSREQIDLLVEPVLEAAIFELTDAIAAGRYEAALSTLSTLLRMQEDPLRILGGVGGQMRRILAAKRLYGAGKTPRDLMQLCSISAYPAQKTMDYARRLPESFCQTAVRACLEADLQMKTSFDEPARILELLVIRLSEEAAHA